MYRYSVVNWIFKWYGWVVFDDWLVGLYVELNMLGVLNFIYKDNNFWYLDRK